MKANTKTKSRSILITCLIAIMALCFSLAGLFALPVKALATSTTCEVSGCSGTYDEDGVCSTTDYHYQAATLTTDKHDVTGDGEPDAVYEIGNYGQYMWFASQVNAGTGRLWNAKLTANIKFADVTYSWENLGTFTYTNQKQVEQIGSELTKSYCGIFDGNYKKIYSAQFDNNFTYGGLFGFLEGTVKNLKLIDVFVVAGSEAGGIVGYSDGGTIENCGVSGIVRSTNMIGGIVGYARDTTIKNSWSNMSELSGPYTNGGIIGTAYGDGNVIENCYYLNTSATVGFSGTVKNAEATAVTAEQIKSGELAYKLGEPWGQTIDKIPTNILAIMWYQIDPNFICEFDLSDIDSINELDEAAVYNYTLPVYKTLSCDSSGTVVYTNTKASETLASHTYDYDGFCHVCGAYEPANRTTDKWDLDEDGGMDVVYEIANEGQLYWFAQQVNSGNNAINAVLYPKLDENFKLNPGTINADGTYTASSGGETVRSWTPIGQTTSRFAGLFDGRGYVISGLYANVNDEYNGLFGITDGAAIFNVGVEDSWIGGKNYCGAVIGKALNTTIGYCYANNVTVGTVMRYNAGLVGFLENSELYNSWCNINDESKILGVLTAYLEKSTMKNCYTSTKRDYCYEECDDSTIENCAQVTEAQFASGEVAYLLGSPWGQDIDAEASGKDTLPVWGGETVYQNLVENGACDGFVYSNTKTTIDESTLTHNYDVTTGICSGCEKQAQAKIGTDVYETLTEALAAVPSNGTTATTITLLCDIKLGKNDRIQLLYDYSKTVCLDGNSKTVTFCNKWAVQVEESNILTLKDITVQFEENDESIYYAVALCQSGTLVLDNATLIGNGEGTVVTVSGGTLETKAGTVIKNGSIGIRCLKDPNDKNTIGTVYIGNETYENITDYAVSAYENSKVYLQGDGFDGKTIYLETGSTVIDNSSEGLFMIETSADSSSVATIANASEHSQQLDKTKFEAVNEGMYVQLSEEGNLIIATCQHSADELEYEKVTDNTLTETCSVCGAVNTIVLKAPDNLVYDGQAKTAYTTGEFFNEEMPSITYCCADGCKIHNNGTAHTATLTFGGYTLKVEFVIEKAPGVASVAIESYGTDDTASVPQISSATNGANGYTVYYKAMGADDSTYTTAGTDVNALNMPNEQGAYTLKVVLNAVPNYTEATAYANFAVGGELPDYTVPENLTAIYGQTLADVDLPDGWTWKDDTLSVGNVGRNAFAAVYNSGVDGEITVECMITVEVTKADQSITLSETEFTYSEGITIDFGALIETVGDGSTTYTIQKSNVAFTFDFAKGVLSNLTRAGGTFTLTVTKAATDNYNEATEAFTITLNKQTVNEPTIASKGWTGEALTADVPSSELYTVTRNNGGTAKGSYDVVLTLANVHLYKWATTNEASVTLTFTITAVANEWTTAPTINGWAYGQSANAPTYAAKYGTVVVEYRLASGTDEDYTTTVPTNAGAYKVRFTVDATEDYGGLSEVIDLTIAKATPVVTAPTAIENLLYTRTAQTLINAGSTTGGTIQYFISGGSWTTALPTKTASGVYTVYYRVVGDENYTDIQSESLIVRISKASPIVTSPTVKTGLTYTSEAQTLITAGSTTGGTMQYKLGDDGTWSANLPTAINAGTYKIYYKVVGDSNYNDNDGGYVNVTIAKKNVTVTAENKTVAQFGTMPEFTYTVTGVIENNYTFDTAPTASVVVENTDTYGTYTISVSGGEDTNYSFTYVEGTLTITEHPHNYSKLVWSATEHWYICSVCDKEQPDSRTEHSGGTATCQAQAVCTTCDQAYGNLGGHSYGTTWEYKDATGHAHVCTVTGCTEHSDIEAHTPNIPAATEESAQYCTACGYTMTVTPPTHTHSHGTTWVTDADEHWNECECGDKANKAAHVDGNGDGKCDTCDYEIGNSGNGGSTVEPPVDTDPPVEDPDNSEKDEEGLGTGAIVAIVVCSVVGVGGGGFALFWFVIRKRRF